MNVIQQDDYRKLGKEFIDLYYPSMGTVGLSKLLYLFSPDVKCTYNGEEMIGEINVLIKLTEVGIVKIFYDSLTYSVQPIEDKFNWRNKLHIDVTGRCQGVTGLGTPTNTIAFTESFVFECTNGQYMIVNHIFRKI
jgi:hypothetical protein